MSQRTPHYSVTPNTARVGPPRTKPTDVRRHELMEAGIRVFVQKGVAGASIDEIVSLASVAKGTFYLYFASKDDLLTALRAHFVERVEKKILEFESRHAQDNWPARLDAWVEGGVRAYLENIEMHDALFHSGDHHPNHREPETNPVIDAFAQFIDAGSRAGAWDAMQADLLAVFLYSALHGGLDSVVRGGRQFDEGAFVRTMQRFVRRALGIGPA